MRLRSLCAVVVVVLSSLALGGASRAEILTTWVIYDGKGAGVYLSANASRVVNAGAELNDSETQGYIADPGMCPHDHYHGTLSGKPDPQDGDKSEHCGWGKVVQDSAASALLKRLMFAVAFEREAVRYLKVDRDLPHAVASCHNAITYLDSPPDGAIQRIDALVPGTLSAEQADAINSHLGKAVNHDGRCADLADDGKRKGALDNVNDGLAEKAKAFKLLNKAGNVLP